MHAPSGGEHALDTSGVEAGAARYCLANLASLGKRYSWFFHLVRVRVTVRFRVRVRVRVRDLGSGSGSGSEVG